MKTNATFDSYAFTRPTLGGLLKVWFPISISRSQAA
jgi:hypothetical protein